VILLRYDWPFDDIPSVCACWENYTADHAIICKCGSFVIQLHNGFRDLEADLLSTVYGDVEVEPVLQDITEEQLSRGSNRALNATDWTFVRVTSGIPRARHSLMWGFARSHSRSIASMKTTRSDGKRARKIVSCSTLFHELELVKVKTASNSQSPSGSTPDPTKANYIP